MSIYQRGKSWYYDFVHKGQRDTGSFGPISRTVAKEELGRKKAEVVEGRLNPATARKSPRFDAFAGEYLAWIQTNRKPRTIERIRYTRARLNKVFGLKHLKEITPWHLEQFKKTRKEQGKAPGTVNLDLSVLNALLHKAQEWGKLEDHPGKTVKFLKYTRQKARFLSDEEEARLLPACSPALRRVVQVALLTGFRRQELATRRPEGVDLERGSISVAACHAKNGESRTLPTGPRLKSVLQEALAARGAASTMLVNDYGRPWHLGLLSEQFRKTCERAHIGSLGTHVLRHTFASRLVMAGIDLRTVQELMGHKSMNMTLRYAHLSSHHTRSAMETLEAQFSPKRPANFPNTPLAAPEETPQKEVVDQ